jgi:predicted ATPase/class 3 adenylate cyclase
MDEPNRLAPLADRNAMAERRQISVLFCHLIPATSMDISPDPAALPDLVPAYRDLCTAVVQRFDGHLARMLDDGFLAYFGYPLAYEDNARRAVQAGLEMLERFKQAYRRESRYEPTIRVGIYAGQAIIGSRQDPDQEPQIALSTAPHLALRLGTMAAPNAVLICATTYQQVQGFFLCDAVDGRQQQELRSPLTVYRVRQASTAQSVFEARATMGLTPLVGRQQEVNLLLEHWQSVRQGRGHAVVLSGEAGIGKSRLLQVLREHLADTPHVLLEYRGSSQHQHSALYPVIELWQRRLELATCANPGARLERLESALAHYRCAGEDTVALLADLLSLPLPTDRYAPLTLTPQRRKQKLFACLSAILAEMAAQQPVLLVVEDLHWVDPSTLEFLHLLLEQVPTLPLLALFTQRPEFRLPWPPRPYVTQHTLGRLAPQQVEQMLTLLAGGKSFPAPLCQQLVTKTDGVPLFVEECARMLLESDWLQERHGHYELRAGLPALAIPVTLRDSLMARLDRLATAKAVAQLAATLGRTFDYALIQAVSPWERGTLQTALRRLVEAEILYQQDRSPYSTYGFRHALLQEVAYQSLLPHMRQQYHECIAGVLVERFPEMVTRQPELVAQHYTAAGCSAQAIPYWQRAGMLASARSACTEAIAHLNQGLQLLATLPDTPERAQQELDIQTILGPALMAVHNPVAAEVERAYARARALCQQVGSTPKLVWALEGLWAFYLVRGRFANAQQLGEQLLSLAERLRTPGAFAVAHQALGLALFYVGEFAAALTHFEAGAAHYALQQPHPTRSGRGLHDPGVMCHAFAALAACVLGYPEQALLRIQTTLELAQEIIHPYSLAFAYCAAAVTHQCRREVAPTQEHATAALALAREQGFPLWAAMGTILRGWALAMQGQGERGIASIRKGLTIWRAAGAENVVPYFLVLLAEAHQATAQVDTALEVLNEALAVVEVTSERWWEAEIYRLRGDFLLLQSPLAAVQAAACFQQALAVAQRQRASLWELRAATSWSRCRAAPNHSAAQQRLRSVYSEFPEASEVADLQQAREHIENPPRG